MKETEHSIQATILEYLLFRGHFVWRNNSGMVFSEYKGVKRAWRAGVEGGADILGIEKATGKFIAVEVKVPGKHATDLQQAFLDNIKQRGGHAFEAHSLEEVIQNGL